MHVCVLLSDWFDDSMLTLLVHPCPLSKPYDSVPENEAALLIKNTKTTDTQTC